ncbi:uncharacterized protein LOC129946318 isoform X1 [Eupeodes corollae]|uniref:uncharacterized protein LOC129946318 isoform X1 n=1 Tax=Eupeodes corollae TaxID=290404 RepID=UPI0024911B2B|nr:uncharacterized protein LOC129946318 isoform X1 [Eupeodes corollae]XP_055912428.1 uncharacterized protein LOC129946318 isoform X1 [Eupeodes corollae]
MNLIAAVSILLVTILTFQTTVINGAKSLAEHKQHSSSSKEHLALESGLGSVGDSLVRRGRGAKSSSQGSEAGGGGSGGGGVVSSCRYSKSAWTECDAKTNSRSRTFTLKKGESSCQQTRTIEKKCKKACRYEKGAWTECTSGQMTRQDKLKTTSDSTCEPVRSINKKCNPGGGGGKPKDKGNKERKNKDKNSRKAAAA